MEFISRHSQASEYGPTAKPLIIVHEKNGMLWYISNFYQLGKFLVENDTLVPISEENGVSKEHQ